jgi:hypothetical protein
MSGMKRFFALTVVLGSSLVLAQTLSTGKYLVTKTEVQAIMNALCESKMDTAKRTCFPKKSFYGQTPRTEKSRLMVEVFGVAGAFTKINSKQVVASAWFMDADGNQERFVAGVSLILENSKVLRQVQDGGSSTCQAFAKGNGQDGLVCKSEALGQGNYETNVFWNDIGANAKPQQLLYVVDNTGGCADPTKIVELGKLERKDINNDKRADLVIAVSYATVPNPNCDVDAQKTKKQTANLVFLWDGKTFKPDATSAKLIAQQGWKL